MSFYINTNINALNALRASMNYNAGLDSSLKKISSGIRINSAADDASGLVISNNLGSQSNGLRQAVLNGNDAIGLLQVADGAMSTQEKILETIQVKANQAAQDSQSYLSKAAIQSDITRLIQELNNIANTTTYNGIQLLDGSFTNKQFQIGADSYQYVDVSINNTASNFIGSTAFMTSDNISAAGVMSLRFFNGNNSITPIAGVAISFSAGTGLGVLANAINAVADQTGVRASYDVTSTASSSVASGNLYGLVLNGVNIGSISNIKANDSDGTLVSALNSYSQLTGVTAWTDSQGRLSLHSIDGRGISLYAGSAGGMQTYTTKIISATTTTTTLTSSTLVTTNITHGPAQNYNIGTTGTISGFNIDGVNIGGNYNLPTDGGNLSSDISANMFATGIMSLGYNSTTGNIRLLSPIPFGSSAMSYTLTTTTTTSNTTYNTITQTITISAASVMGTVLGLSSFMNDNYGRLTLTGNGARTIQLSASGAPASSTVFSHALYTSSTTQISGIFSAGALAAGGAFGNNVLSGLSSNFGYAGVTTFTGAQMTMSIAQNAASQIDAIRASIGATINKIHATISNAAITQVNVAASQSQIKDTDFAQEAYIFDTFQILAQVGAFAISHANIMQENVLRLLQM